MKEFDGNIPQAELLSLREKLARLGQLAMESLGSSAQSATGELPYSQYVGEGIQDAQYYANTH